MPASVEQFRAAATALHDPKKPDSDVTLRFKEFGDGIASTRWQRFQVLFFDIFRYKETIAAEKARTVREFLSAVEAEGQEVSQGLGTPLRHLAGFSVHYSPRTDRGKKLKASAAADALQQLADLRGQWSSSQTADAWALADKREKSILFDHKDASEPLPTLLTTQEGLQHSQEMQAAPQPAVRKAEAKFGRPTPMDKAVSLECLVQEALGSLDSAITKSRLSNGKSVETLKQEFKDPEKGSALDEMKRSMENYADNPYELGEASESHVFDPETLGKPESGQPRIVDDGSRYRACRRIAEGFIFREFNRRVVQSFFKENPLDAALSLRFLGMQNGKAEREKNQKLIQRLADVEEDRLSAPAVVTLKPERVESVLSAAREGFVELVCARFDALRKIDALQVPEAFKNEMMRLCLEQDSAIFTADFFTLMNEHVSAMNLFAEMMVKADGPDAPEGRKKAFFSLAATLESQFQASRGAELKEFRVVSRTLAIQLGMIVFAGQSEESHRRALLGWVGSDEFKRLETDLKNELHSQGGLRIGGDVPNETRDSERQLGLLPRIAEAEPYLKYGATV